jgi:hypothetical protein
MGTSGGHELDPLKMGPIDCSETSVINYHYSLRNKSEERSSHNEFNYYSMWPSTLAHGYVLKIHELMTYVNAQWYKNTHKTWEIRKSTQLCCMLKTISVWWPLSQAVHLSTRSVGIIPSEISLWKIGRLSRIFVQKHHWTCLQNTNLSCTPQT